jgi:hypothetical protein
VPPPYNHGALIHAVPYGNVPAAYDSSVWKPNDLVVTVDSANHPASQFEPMLTAPLASMPWRTYNVDFQYPNGYTRTCFQRAGNHSSVFTPDWGCWIEEFWNKVGGPSNDVEAAWPVW